MKGLFDIKDRVILITGAAGILGTAMVKHFAEEGAKVVILDRNTEAGEKLAKQVTDAGFSARFFYTDVLNT